MPILQFFPPLLLGPLILICFTSSTAKGQVLFLNTTVVPNVKWNPGSLGKFRVGDERTLWLLIDSNGTAWSGPVEISCEWAHGCPMEDCSVVHSIQLDQSNGFTQSINLTLKGTALGLNRLFAKMGRKQFWYRVRTWKTPLGSMLTQLFMIALGVAMFTGNFMAGLQMDLSLVPKFPMPLLAAGICQFVVMPLVGFCAAKYLLTGQQPFVLRLALFLVSCAPAGAGKSAFWSVLFDGNLELVAALTFVQRIGTLVFLPFWLHFLGHAFFVDRVHVPMRAVGYGLLLVLKPFMLGMVLMRIGAREIVQRCTGCLKVFLWLGTALFLVLAIPATLPNLRVLSWDLLICIGLLLPCTAHFVAFLLARIFRLSPRDARTVTIECGIQSASLPAIILLFSLGEPERDVALAVPVAVALLTDKPLLALCVGRISRRAIAILKGGEAGGGNKIAAASNDQQPEANGTTTPKTNSTQQIAELWDTKLIRVRQLDEPSKLAMARRNW